VAIHTPSLLNSCVGEVMHGARHLAGKECMLCDVLSLVEAGRISESRS
jgi:hypothetical protein